MAVNPKNNIVKRRSGEKLEGREKQIIFNVFNYLRIKNPQQSISKTVEDTAEATGCSTQTVFRIRKEAISGSFKSPSKIKPRKNINKNSRLIKYDDFVRSVIRKKVHDCLFKNLPLTLNSIMSIVNEDSQLPNFKRSTLHKVLNEMGFKYEKKGKTAMYVENVNIINTRHVYLKEMQRLRNEKCNIFYIGETLIELSINVNNDVNEYNLENNEIQSSKYLILQAASEIGFLKNIDFVCYMDKKSTLESCRYEDWIKNMLLINIPPSSVIIVDNSSHHRWQSVTLPDKSWHRDKIKEWLTAKCFPFKDDSIKKDLLDIINRERGILLGNELEEHIKNHGHTLLELPVQHCELSILPAVWNQIKQHINANTNTNKCENNERIIWEALQCVGADMWRQEHENVLKAEDNMWRANLIQNNMIKDTPEAAKNSVTMLTTKTDAQSDQTLWFTDFMRLRGVNDYQQYTDDRQHIPFDMMK